jgi:hypothetical protein
VKVSSPVKQNVPEWPSKYVAAKAASAVQTAGTLGVQVHGMYRRLFQELGRSQADRTLSGSIPKAKVDNRASRNTMHEKSDWLVVATKRSNVRGAKGPAALGLAAHPSRACTSTYTFKCGMKVAANKSFGSNPELRSPLPKLGTAGSARGLFLSLTGEE